VRPAIPVLLNIGALRARTLRPGNGRLVALAAVLGVVPAERIELPTF
jgi:hypothetical protein